MLLEADSKLLESQAFQSRLAVFFRVSEFSLFNIMRRNISCDAMQYTSHMKFFRNDARPASSMLCFNAEIMTVRNPTSSGLLSYAMMNSALNICKFFNFLRWEMRKLMRAQSYERNPMELIIQP